MKSKSCARSIRNAAAVLLCALFVIPAPAPSSAALIEQRAEWWQRRVDTIAARRAGFEKSGDVDRRLLLLLDKELSRGHEMLRVLKSSQPDSRDLSEKEGASETSVTGMADVIRPVIAVHLLRSATEPQSENLEMVREALSARIESLLRENGIPAGKKLAAEILAQEAGRDDLAHLALELVLISALNDKKQLEATLVPEIESHFAAEFSKSKDEPGSPEMRHRVINYAQEKLDRLHPPAPAAGLEGSAIWNGIAGAIREDLPHYKKIMAMLPAEKDARPQQSVRHYLRNIASLDTVYFRGIAAKLTGNKAQKDLPAAFGNLIQAMQGINRVRQGIIPSLSGKEESDYFESVDSRFEKIVSSYKVSPELSGKAADYRKESVDFLKWASSAKRRDGARIAGAFQSVQNRCVEYADFILSLSREAGATAAEDTALYANYRSALQQVPALLATLDNTVAIRKESIPHLQPGQIRDMKKRKTEFTRYLKTVQAEISGSYLAHSRRRSDTKAALVGEAAGREKKAAQYDVELLVTSLAQHHAFYRQLDYARRALNDYRQAYDRIRSDPEGAGKKALEKCLQAQSLIPSVEGFDPDKIRREYATKSYLRKEVRSLVSAISSLMNFYGHKGIRVSSLVSRETLESTQKAVDAPLEVQVADWMMNERNFSEIDKKVIQSLQNASTRRAWSGDAESARSVRVQEAGISIAVPEGWSESPVMPREKEKGIIGAWASPDEKARIEIAGIAASGDDLRLSSIRWLGSLGFAFTRGKWGSRGETDYFWSISRASKGGKARESYAFKSNDRIIFLSGTSDGGKYNFLKKKLDPVFDSLRREK